MCVTYMPGFLMLTDVPVNVINKTACKINVQMAKNSTDTQTVSIVLREIQHDTECDETGSLNYRYNSLLPAE